MSGQRGVRARAGVPAARPRGPRRPRVSSEGVQPDPIRRGEEVRWSLEAKYRVDLERHSDIRHPYLTGNLRPVAGEKARLRKSEGDCRMCLHNWSVGGPGVSVEPRGHVDGDDLLLRGVDGLDPRREGALRTPGQASSEDGVDHSVRAFEPQFAFDFDPNPSQRDELFSRRSLQPRAVDAADAGELAPAVEVPRRGQPITRVVPDAADDRGAVRAEPGHLPTRGLHQPVDRDAEALLRERVDLFDLAAAKRRQGAGRQTRRKGRAGGWSRPATRQCQAAWS